MGMRFIVLLVITTITINSASGLEQDITSKLATRNVRTATTKRSLRVVTTEAANLVDTEDSTDSEERANVQGLSKLAELDNPTWKLRKFKRTLSNKIWLRLGKDPEDVLNSLLVHGKQVIIDENKRALQWFRFVEAYRAARGADQFPDDQIYSILKPIAEESKLATLFESLKQIPDLKNIAETMQNYQFNLWKGQKKKPEYIAKLLGISPHGPTSTDKDPRNEILKGFTKVFNENGNAL